MIDRAEPTTSDSSSLGAILAGYLEGVSSGQASGRDELLAADPDLEDELRAFFADYERMTPPPPRFAQPWATRSGA